MEELALVYLVVTKVPGNASKIISCNTERDVLTQVTKISMNHEDPRTITNIMSVDEFGDVWHYEVVFEGKLILKPLEAKTILSIDPEADAGGIYE